MKQTPKAKSIQITFKAPELMVQKIREELPKRGYSTIAELTKELWRRWLIEKGVTPPFS